MGFFSDAVNNVFCRGDFDEYKISDEELEEIENKDFDSIEKAYKYIRRWYSNGEWHYIYPPKYRAKKNRTKTKIEIAKKTKVITNIKPMFDATEEQIDNAILQMSLFAMDGKLKCKALGNNSIYVETKTQDHIKETKGKRRPFPEIQHKAQYIPFIPEIIKNGVLCEKSKTSSGVIYGVIGQVEYTNKSGKVVKEAIELAINYDESTDKFVFSFSNYEIKKSLLLNKDFNDNFLACPIVDTETVPITIYRIAEYKKMSSKNVTKSLTFSGYKLQGRTKLYGMDISIENKKGSYRSGTDSDGHEWKTFMHYDYGYIRGTVGTDKDHVDCYIGDDKESQKVYVIHQNNPVTHEYDEDKCMLCFSSAEDAKKAYMKQYDRPGFFGSMETLSIEKFKEYVFNNKGKRIHKSLDYNGSKMAHKSFQIDINDITVNNREKKALQVEKSLMAVNSCTPFKVNHISGNDGSKKLGNLSMLIRNFDMDSINKAVRTLSFTLDTPLKSAKCGECFVYKSQEELTDRIVSELTEKTKALYEFVIDYFGLPEKRIMTKAYLKYKGKLVYDPETGKPIKKKDWDKFVEQLEKFLNRNYTGIGEKIVLKAETLGRIIERMSKNGNFEAIKKMSLDDMEYKRRKFDWISDSVKNMTDTFGETLSRERMGRVQVAIDSAANRVTHVTNTQRDNIKQIIIDGVKNKQSKSKISQQLFDSCVGANRDFQRIADTEVQSNSTRAYIDEEVYNTKPDEKVYFKRFEQLDDNTCKKCKKIKGMIALWSDYPMENEKINDPYADYAIWDGKTDGVAPQTTLHPWCRGTWYRYYPDV